MLYIILVINFCFAFLYSDPISKEIMDLAIDNKEMKLPTNFSYFYEDYKINHGNVSAMLFAIENDYVEEACFLAGFGPTSFIDFNDCIRRAIDKEMIEVLSEMSNSEWDFTVRISDYKKNGYLQLGYNQSLLHYAINSKLVFSAEFLIKLGLNPNDINMYCAQSPLFLAAGISQNAKTIEDQQKAFVLTKLLIDVGADINLCDYKGMSPLMRVCNGSHHYALVCLLVEHGANIHLKLENGATTFQFALRKGNESLTYLEHELIVALLIKCGSDIHSKCPADFYYNAPGSTKGKGYLTPIEAAALQGDYIVLSMIFDELKKTIKN